MHIGASRADRFGFIVFTVLAALLAVLLVTNFMSSDQSETATEVSTFADLPEPTAVPTTAPLTIPDPTPTATPVVLPTATPTPEPEPTAATTDGDSSASNASGTTTNTSNSSSNPTALAAPGTDTPNPQPATTAVPNPQPGSTAVPNPQPGAAIDVPAPAATGGSFTHTLRARSGVSQVTLYNSPGGSAFMPTFNGTALPATNPTYFGNTLVYRVLAGAPGDQWAQVYVPARPNGTKAWVQTSQFDWGSSNRMIQINISTNTVTVFEGSNVLLTTSAVTGKGSSRTPVAQGWVEEIMPGPSGAYGPQLISLGIFSNDLSSFGGGVPKIALHGTNNPSLMGQYASNGCVRVRNEIITQIAGMISVGSKVVITT